MYSAYFWFMVYIVKRRILIRKNRIFYLIPIEFNPLLDKRLMMKQLMKQLI